MDDEAGAVSSEVERSRHMREVEGSNPSRPTMFPITVALFWGRVSVGQEFECWNWHGQTNDKGYGRFRGAMAHRVAYELINGEIGDGLILRHSCDNPRCCNPHHLTPGTHQDNMDDAVARQRTARGAAHPKTKLTEEQASYILGNPDGLTGGQLAAKFGIAESTVSYIRNRKSWKYAKPAA